MSKNLENLKTAFMGESEARNKYTVFAWTASPGQDSLLSMCRCISKSILFLQARTNCMWRSLL